MADQNFPACKIRIIWPEAKTCDPFETHQEDLSPQRRFEKPPATDAELASLLEVKAIAVSDAQTDLSIMILVASDGSLGVSSQALTAFSDHFARIARSNMRETVTRTVELTNFSLSTLKSMIVYMSTGELPSDIDELRRLSELSGYILHEPMERQTADAILRNIAPEKVASLADFAQPTGVLYSKILRFLARSCAEEWFFPNVLGPDGVGLEVLRDLLRRDDLQVTSEAEVMSMIDAWTYAHPGADFSNFADVVRSSWLPRAQFGQISSKIPSAPGDSLNSEYCCRPRHRYLRHVHLVTLETIRNQSGVPLRSHMENLDLPRFPPTPIFSTFINLLCSAEGQPTKILARFEAPNPGDGGVICTTTPYKLEYFEQFGVSKTPAILMMIPSGVAKLQLRPYVTCEFLPLVNFTQRPVTKLVDIRSCDRGLLLYLQKAEEDLIVLVSKDSGEAELAMTIEVPMTRPRLYLKDDLLHVECHYALLTVVVRLDNFSVVRRFEHGLVVCDNDILCEDLQELHQQLCEESARLTSTGSLNESIAGDRSSGPSQKRIPDGDLSKTSSSPNALTTHENGSSSRFILRCDDDLRFNRRKTVTLSIPPRGPELLRIEGEATNVVIGFVPHRLFTVADICEPLPTG